MSIKVLGIDHVALNVKDINEALHFYTEIIGLKISQREYQKPGIEYFLDCGPSLVGLIQANDKTEPHLFQHDGLGANHFSFRVTAADFDDILKKLEENSVKIDFYKKRERSWSVYFQDRDGNKLEMTAWPLEEKPLETVNNK